jgi:hypothetical protein
MLGSQLLYNPFVATLFYLMIAFTFFAPLLQVISEALPVFALSILSYQQKHRIKLVRAWTLLYLVIAVFWRVLLPLWNLSGWFNIIISTICWFGLYGLTRLIAWIGLKPTHAKKAKNIEKPKEYTETYERLVSPYWILFIAILVTWGVFCIIIPDPVAIFSYNLFIYFFQDMYLAAAFISLVSVSIGWAILEGFFKLALYLRLARPDIAAYVIKIIQFIVIVLFFIIILFQFTIFQKLP